MNLEEFNALSDEEKSTFLTSVETDHKSITDLEAERDSFKTENTELKKQLEANNKELKATKEMNFSLARKINTSPQSDDETTLHEFMKGI